MPSPRFSIVCAGLVGWSLVAGCADIFGWKEGKPYPPDADLDASVDTVRSDADDALGSEGDRTDVPPSMGMLRVLPTTGDFGRVVSGARSGILSFELSNTGSGATEPVGAILTGADAPSFAIADPSCAGKILQPSSRCTLGVQFAPNGPGARTATLLVS